LPSRTLYTCEAWMDTSSERPTCNRLGTGKMRNLDKRVTHYENLLREQMNGKLTMAAPRVNLRGLLINQKQWSVYDTGMFFWTEGYKV